MTQLMVCCLLLLVKLGCAYGGATAGSGSSHSRFPSCRMGETSEDTKSLWEIVWELSQTILWGKNVFFVRQLAHVGSVGVHSVVWSSGHPKSLLLLLLLCSMDLEQKPRIMSSGTGGEVFSCLDL